MGCLSSKSSKPGSSGGSKKKLVEACGEGDVSAVKAALDRGEPVDSTDFSYRTGLMEAAGGNFVDVAQLLISRGANVNMVNKNGRSNALHCCVGRHDDPRVSKVLVDAGIDVNAQESMHGMVGKTPLSLAASKGRKAQVEYLVSLPACDLGKTGSAGKTAADTAEDAGYPDIAAIIRAAEVRARVCLVFELFV